MIINLGLQTLLILVVIFLLRCDCDNVCRSSAGERTNRTSPDIKTEFQVSTVDRQFIITFKGWYSEPARKGFIDAALKSLAEAGEQFSIIARNNPMAEYPSDFDLLVFSEDNVVSQSVQLLLQHPLVKSVTPQRMVTRFLSGFEDDPGSGEDSSCEECKGSWVNGRRSLSLGSAFWQTPAAVLWVPRTP